MDIHTLMKEFSQLGEPLIGQGPKHPTSPMPELQKEIDDFLEKNPYLKRDQGYIDFLEIYSGALVCWPSQEDCASSVGILGFCRDISFSIAQPDYDLVTKDGFFIFANTTIFDEHNSRFIGTDYVFDITGERSNGVYMHYYDVYNWCSSTFLDWLRDVIDKRGNLRVE